MKIRFRILAGRFFVLPAIEYDFDVKELTVGWLIFGIEIDFWRY